VTAPRSRLPGDLTARVRAALLSFADFDLEPIASSLQELDFILTTNAAALLILVKKPVAYRSMTAEAPRTGRTRRRDGRVQGQQSV